VLWLGGDVQPDSAEMAAQLQERKVAHIREREPRAW